VLEHREVRGDKIILLGFPALGWVDVLQARGHGIARQHSGDRTELEHIPPFVVQCYETRAA